MENKGQTKGTNNYITNKLRETEVRYHAIFDQSPFGILLIDTKGAIIEFNEAAHCQLGYSREEFSKLHITDVDPLQTPEEIEASMKEVLTAGKAEFEVKHRTKKGEIRDVRVITKVMDLAGQAYFQTLWQDITEHKRADEEIKKYRDHLEDLVKDRTAELIRLNEHLQRDIAERKRVEKRLEESEKLYRMLFQSAGDAIFILDTEGEKAGRIVATNQAAAEMHGYKIDELLTLNIKELDTPESARDAEGRISRMLNGEWIKAEITHRRKDGSVFPVEISAGLLELENHKYILAFDRDITERKKLEEELLKTGKLESIAYLAGGIAHDFNNLLAGILGHISLAKKFLDPLDKTYEILTAAGDSCLRAKDLTHYLLTFAKGGQPLKKKAPLSELLRSVAGLSLGVSHVKCEFSLPDGLWPAEVDAEQIGQVIHNLMVNAIEALPYGGIVAIRAENRVVGKKDNLPIHEGNYVKISIEDQGKGIPKEHLHRIFDPYFTTKKMDRTKGTGLGLAVCYSIIKKHEGYIYAESEVGVGTTFHIYLPASATFS